MALLLLIASRLAFCLYVYLKQCVKDSMSASNSIDVISLQSRRKAARLVYRRIVQVLWLYWRSMLIILLVLVAVAFYATVYLKIDYLLLHARARKPQALAKVRPFILCLLEHQGRSDACYDLAGKALITEETAAAVIMLLGVCCPSMESSYVQLPNFTRPPGFSASWYFSEAA